MYPDTYPKFLWSRTEHLVWHRGATVNGLATYHLQGRSDRLILSSMKNLELLGFAPLLDPNEIPSGSNALLAELMNLAPGCCVSLPLPDGIGFMLAEGRIEFARRPA